VSDSALESIFHWVVATNWSLGSTRKKTYGLFREIHDFEKLVKRLCLCRIHVGLCSASCAVVVDGDSMSAHAF